LSVVVVKRPCVLQVKERAPVFAVDNEKCKMCRACLKMGCPALTIVKDKIMILAHFCRGCGTCAFSCKFGAIGRVGEK
jgi:indolepyruvate ferredoxin oxidoreductase, alpha subunit